MSEQEFNAARAVVYAGAGTHVQALLEAAGIPPPPDEDLAPPELSQQEKLTKCVNDFKKATNQMKNLVEKKAKLQARADKLKQELEKLISDVDQVDKDIASKDAEIQETAKTFKDLTADSTSTAFSALETVLADAGHELSEAHACQDEGSTGRQGRFPRGPLSGPVQWGARVRPQGNAAPLRPCPHRHAWQPAQPSRWSQAGGPGWHQRHPE